MAAEKHPLGFTKVNLVPLPFGARLRLHVWPPGRRETEQPHDHRWWFLSLPLWGSLQDSRYRPDPAGESFKVMRAQHPEASRTGHLEPTGSVVRLTLASRTVRRPLSLYAIRRLDVHAVTPATDGRAASLVLIGPPKSSCSIVYERCGP